MLLMSIALLIAAAPLIGLGQHGYFVLFQLAGIRRGVAFATILTLVLLVCSFQILSIGVSSTPALPRWRAVILAAWNENKSTFTHLSGRPIGIVSRRECQHIAVLVAGFAAVFAVLLSKCYIVFETFVDQVWHQTFVDYDVDWHTSIFYFAGNVLYNFGIQVPINTQLLPILGLAQFFPHDQ